jgi:LuxR family maltose regulon positive regulatory protein
VHAIGHIDRTVYLGAYPDGTAIRFESFSHAQALHFMALALSKCGGRERALDLLRPALAEATAHHRPERMILLGARADILLNAGELDAAADTAEHMLSLAHTPATDAPEAGIVRLWRGWARNWLGSIRYEQNDLESAAEHWRQVEAMRYQVAPGAYLGSLIGLAHVAQAQGEAVQALAYAQAAREYALEMHSPPFLRRSEALEVRLALAGGQHAEALRRAQEIDAAANQGSATWLEQPCLTVCLRALLAEATPDSLTTARRLAETCLCQAGNAHNPGRIIQAAALSALVWRALRRTPEALAALDRVLALAEPRDFVRTFLDLGAPLAELLQHYERQHRSSSYVKRLLAAYARELDPAGRHDLAAQYVRLHGITPLTQRELELLDLVAQRLTYREIAERLVISPNTVKKHVSNVYGKLGVSNRRQAIAKAQEVGLL